MKALLIFVIGLMAVAGLGGNAYADSSTTTATTAHSSHDGHGTAVTIADSPAYPVDYCVVSGEKLGGMGDPVKYDYKGRTVMFCCGGCIKKFEAEPAKYIAVLDAAVADAAPAKAKPTTTVDTTKAKSATRLTALDWCIVSGETLGDMGKPIAYEWKDREMDFCCKSCVKIFEKQPVAYLARLDSALAGQIVQPKRAEEKPKQEENHGGHTH